MNIIIKNNLQRIKKIIKNEPENNLITKKGVNENIFGHILYQNIQDEAIDFSSLNNIPINHYKYDEIGYIVKNVKKGQTVIDIGANIGFFTLLMARKVGPKGKVYAFEPGPVSFGLLSTNVNINRYTNVILENKAVGNINGQCNLLICPTGESDNWVLNKNEDPSIVPEGRRELRKIDTVKLDNYFGSKKQPIHFVKLDVQGGEYWVLKGMESIMKLNEDIAIIMEYNVGGPRGISPEEFLKYIRSFGFNIYELYSDKPIKKVTDNYLLTEFGPQATHHTEVIFKRG